MQFYGDQAKTVVRSLYQPQGFIDIVPNLNFTFDPVTQNH